MTELVLRVLSGDNTKDLARRLMSKAPGLSCRVCGGRDFGLLEDADGNSRTALARQPIGGGSPQQFAMQPLVTLVCTNCGHIEQFAEAILVGARPEDYGSEVAP